jgi:5-methylcytosine-specific restriction endonuclease McrA
MTELPPPPLTDFRTLVLDATWRPVRAIGWERAITLGLGTRVEVLEYYGRMVHTASAAFALPAVILVRRYVSKHPGRVSMSRRNILTRDRHRCGYCGARALPLTLDHIHPRSRGGRSTWENLITCCGACNRKKGDRTPREARMPLLVTPRRPSAVEFGRDGLALADPPDEWSNYLAKAS